MIFTPTFFINKLFDFDLTFVLELVLFITLAIIVTFNFINPVSNAIDDHAEFLNYNCRKSTI